MLWQILIATTFDRRIMFDNLITEFKKQIIKEGLQDKMEILFDEDNREKSIGKKRQDLLERATAEYICFFDSDDFPYPNYIKDIYTGLLMGFDCIGMIINMTTNGSKPQVCCHSIRYPQWQSKVDGYDYVRNCTHFNPVKRELALMAGFPDMRYGEDIVYSNKVSKLCHNEYFIANPLFHYRYSNLETSSKKYGIG